MSSLVSAWWWWWWSVWSPALSSRLASATAWMTLQLVSVFTSTLSSGLESPLAGAEVKLDWAQEALSTMTSSLVVHSSAGVITAHNLHSSAISSLLGAALSGAEEA